MKTATVADLRNNFRLISSWIEHGETVQIIKRGRPFASLTGMGRAPSNFSFPKPDILAQLQEVWGDRVFSMDEVRAMREAERAEDHG
jgi:antitoxin (DNA-binding transcriptional repressor) of toxin-antitoxin stability system